ncbi:MAG: sensor histidine kinase [Bacteroidales bacterium]
MKFSFLRHIKWLYLLIFSGLGLFSYFLLMRFTDIPQNSNVDLISLPAFIYFIFAFNILGFSIYTSNRWINKESPLYFIKRRRSLMRFLGICILLFIVNYGLLILAKFLAGVSFNDMFYVRNNGLKVFISVWFVELIIVLLMTANQSYSYTLDLYKKASQLNEESNKAKYAALQSQLNPHFLFNSLNTLISEIEYNPQNAIAFTTHLSDVYRYILECQEKTTVQLKEELVFLESYLFLHQVRLGSCIHLHIAIPDSCLEYKVPPLTLQLLAENIIKHNSISMSKPMQMDIRVDVSEKQLIISNPIHPKLSKGYSGKGLQNLRMRYLLLENKDIVVESNNEVFIVKVPLLDE